MDKLTPIYDFIECYLSQSDCCFVKKRQSKELRVSKKPKKGCVISPFSLREIFCIKSFSDAFKFRVVEVL